MAITTDDFDKIWASTSPLTPYEFSESQYKDGWNFIGATPPSRQMWDFLQKNNDEKMQYLADNYLPLSGGTLTGDVNGVTPADSDDSTKLATTEFVDNVFLAKIISKLQETESLPSGTSFPSASILSKMISNMNTEDGIQYSLSNRAGWYIKFGSKFGGLVIQGGEVTMPSNSTTTSANLPTHISANLFVMGFPVIGGISTKYNLYDMAWISGDGNTVTARLTTATSNAVVNYIVIGIA